MMKNTQSSVSFWQGVALGVMCLLTTSAFASTAVNDVYTIDTTSPSEEHLVVAYNDIIFLDSEEAANAAKIVGEVTLSDPSAGIISINTSDNLSFDFTPTQNYEGQVTFTYVLQDIRGTSEAEVVLNLARTTSTQVEANDDTYQSDGGVVLLYPIENDRLAGSSNANGGSITFDALGENEGTLEVQSAAANLFIYTPPADVTEITTVTLNYTLSSTLGNDTAKVVVTIDPSLSRLVNNANDELQSVGEVVEAACAIGSSSGEGTENDEGAQNFSNTCDVLLNLPAADIPDALDQLIPDQIGQQANDALDVATVNVDNIQQRLGNLRAGNTGVSFSGLKARINGTALALGSLLDSELRGGGAGDDSETAFSDGRIGFFVTGSITTGEKDDADGLDGFDFDSQMLTLGSDYRASNALIVGVAVGLGDTTSESSNSGSEFDSKTVSFSFYGNWYPSKNIYMDWVAGYSDNEYDSVREINFGTGAGAITSTADGSADGNQVSLSTSMGWEMPVSQWMITTYGRAGYIESTIESYDESDTAGLVLSIEEQVIRTIPVSFGANIERVFSLPFGVLIPEAEVEWIKDLNDDARTVKAGFVNSPDGGTFSSKTAAPDTDYIEASLSVTALFKGGFMTFFRYSTELSRDDYTVSTVELGARMEF